MAIVGRGFVGVEVKEPALVVARQHGDQVDVVQLVEGGDVGVREKDADVGVAGLDGRHLGFVVGYDQDVDLVQIGPAAPVVVVGLEDQVAAGLPLLEGIGTVPDADVAVPGGIVDCALGLKNRPQNVLGQNGLVSREDGGRPGGEGLGEFELQSLVVHRRDTFQVSVVRPGALHAGVSWIEDHLVGEDKVVGRHRRAVGPVGVWIQGNGDGQSVLGDQAVIGGGELGSHLQRGLQIVVPVPQPGVQDIVRYRGEPHPRVHKVQAVGFLEEGHGQRLGFCLGGDLDNHFHFLFDLDHLGDDLFDLLLDLDHLGDDLFHFLLDYHGLLHDLWLWRRSAGRQAGNDDRHHERNCQELPQIAFHLSLLLGLCV